MGYESINKQRNDEIQDLADGIVDSLHANDGDYTRVDRVALDKLLKLLTPKLKYQIWKYIKDEDDLSDLLNDCLIKVYTKIGMYNQKYRFTTWVYTITYNAVVSFLKNPKKRNEIPLSFSSMSTKSTYISELERRELPELEDFDLDGVVSDEIHSLPDGLNKDIMIDTQYNHLKIRELSTKYKMSESTVKTKQRLTREKIKNGILNKFPILKENVGAVIYN